MSRASVSRLPHSQLAPSLVRLRRFSDNLTLGGLTSDLADPAVLTLGIALGPIIIAGSFAGLAGATGRRPT
jgi:hypothetical protein